jgi:hypothetical protein
VWCWLRRKTASFILKKLLPRSRQHYHCQSGGGHIFFRKKFAAKCVTSQQQKLVVSANRLNFPPQVKRREI